MKNFRNFGVMIDMSRNAVMSVEGLKRYFVLLKKMGYSEILKFDNGILHAATAFGKTVVCSAIIAEKK